MAGIEDDPSAIGDWPPTDPGGPQGFISSFLSDDFGSRSFADGLPEEGKGKAVAYFDQGGGVMGVEISHDPFRVPNQPSVPRPGARGGLAERMAARAGFSAPKLNTARIRSLNLAPSSSSSSEVRSPYLTIPSGLSPTTLLDSPVFLSNSMAQPSPTTGKFPLEQSSTISSVPVSINSDKTKVHTFVDGTESFVFKPPVDSGSRYFSNSSNKVASTVDHPQSLPTIDVSVQSELPKHESENFADVRLQNLQEFNIKSCFSESSDQRNAGANFAFNQNISDSVMGDEQSPPLDDQQDGEGEAKGESSSVAVGALSEDGYNWRKYGQKQVKGSEFPRSYYKCTHPNCQVKKKVERSHEGHITEIIYKGTHNHLKPPPNRRSAVPASQPFGDVLIDGSEIHASQAVLDGRSTWANAQGGNMGPDWKSDGLEVTSSAPVATEFGDPSSVQVQNGHRFEPDQAVDVATALSNDEDEDDRATHGSISLGFDGEDDESESKRRKLDTSAMEMSAASRAVREPRVVVQTTSEVDILDDGYRWRKYGQKVVKGNPNPRSYYKCTNPGCMVRKHVERASHDLKSVITTYEGKHNHDVPAARNSSHAISGPSSTVAASASQAHSTHRMPEHSHDSLPRFDGPLPLGTFPLSGREQLGPPTGFSFGMGQQGITNLAMPGLGPPTQMKMLPPVHPYLRPPNMNGTGFMMPKGEPKDETVPDSSLAIPNGPSVYHQIMSRLPLGPQL
uniref:Putative WRKY transcription factor 2 n=1 Tax=Anthurium amnicola TaxID=1678845 RepID=A0A1D1XC23_9ARAE